MKKTKYAALMMDLSEPKLNLHVVLNEDLEVELFEEEDEAIKFIAYEYTGSYEFCGLVPNPEKIFKTLKKRSTN